MSWKELDYPRVFVDLADELAHLRTFHSKHIYKKGTEQYRGDQEHKISVLGILAELIARHHFEESKNIDFEVAPLVTDRPVVSADIILDGLGEKYLIDVKGVKYHSAYLRINFKAHNNINKKITHYFFIMPITRTKAKYLWVDYDQVNKWEVIESTYTKCYQKEIKTTN